MPYLNVRVPPYDARAVANYFLELSRRDGKSLDQMKVQKLVFLAHGWYLALTGKPLITERIEAWRFGPVVRSLYAAFREAGSGPITRPACQFQLVEGRLVSTPIQLEDLDNIFNRQAKQVLDEIWRVYGGFSGPQLSNLAHMPGTPWANTWATTPEKTGLVIDDSVIRNYFQGLPSHEYA